MKTGGVKLAQREASELERVLLVLGQSPVQSRQYSRELKERVVGGTAEISDAVMSFLVVPKQVIFEPTVKDSGGK